MKTFQGTWPMTNENIDYISINQQNYLQDERLAYLQGSILNISFSGVFSGIQFHEASKFTFTMAHIPLIMNFSDSFIETHRDKYNVLKNHSAAYWSNDLLYDLLIDLMDIDGVNINQDLDLASKQYK